MCRLFGRGGKIRTLDGMHLTLRTMTGGEVFRLTGEGERAALWYSREASLGDPEPKERRIGGGPELIRLMNACGALYWDGFHGRHPGRVRDGMSFRFMACVNGGRPIRAEGSARFPKGFSEFVRALKKMAARDDGSPDSDDTK